MPEVPKVPEVLQSKTDERASLLLGEGEAGFWSWWKEQLERRERVAQTCDRSTVGCFFLPLNLHANLFVVKFLLAEPEVLPCVVSS